MIATTPSAQIYTTGTRFHLHQGAAVNMTISVYSNCVLVVVNETGSIGSIMRGSAEVQMEKVEECEDWEQGEAEIGKREYIYQCRTLFGSTEIEFYEVVMRRLLELVFEENKMPIEARGEKTKVILNIALAKVHAPQFQAHMQANFNIIVGALQKILPQVI